MTLFQVLRSKPLHRLALFLIWLFIGGAVGHGSTAWAGDPGGDKTGATTDAQNAGGEAFIVTEPDQKDPDYAKKKEAYDEFKGLADKEPLAAKLADFVGQNRIAINLMWTLVTGFLVMFMQAGIALVETGLCRAKNASHTMLMNFLIYRPLHPQLNFCPCAKLRTWTENVACAKHGKKGAESGRRNSSNTDGNSMRSQLLWVSQPPRSASGWLKPGCAAVKLGGPSHDLQGPSSSHSTNCTWCPSCYPMVPKHTGFAASVGPVPGWRR